MGNLNEYESLLLSWSSSHPFHATGATEVSGLHAAWTLVY